MRFLIFFFITIKIFANDCIAAEEFLITQSLKKPLFVQEYCAPRAGVWISVNGNLITNAEKITVDYLLHPIWIWEHTNWKPKKQKRFFNSFDNMILIETDVIRNEKIPGAWLPKQNKCSYLTKELETIKNWKIKISATEKRELEILQFRVCEFEERIAIGG